MKNLPIIVLCFLFASACKTNTIDLVPVTQTLPADNTVMQQTAGSFVNGVHTVSGTVKVVVSKTDATKRSLVFENFKTEAGPDLYIYLAEDQKSTNYTEVIKLANTGSFTVDIPATAKLDKQKYVLVWCKQYTVLFGSAKLE